MSLPPQVFSCQATGIPEPVISWENAIGEILPVNNGDLAPDLGVVGREDSGVYTCVATNAGGESRAEFVITVQGYWVE